MRGWAYDAFFGGAGVSLVGFGGYMLHDSFFISLPFLLVGLGLAAFAVWGAFLEGWEDAQRMHTRILATALETVTSLREQMRGKTDEKPNDDKP